MLDSLLDVFQKQNPSIAVEASELSWADGQSKLQLAFNAGTQPDVVHIGLDWFWLFDEGGVFAELPNQARTTPRAAWWLVNVRALVVQNPPPYRYGFATSDRHNVLKRCLPLLWQSGVPNFYTRLPLWPDCNEELVLALDSMRRTILTNAMIDRSRELDQALLKGDITAVLTGAWIVEMARERNQRALSVLPMRSVLNADVLTISQRSANRAAAGQLIDFLCSYTNARAFASSVPDAGFPADLQKVGADTAFLSNPLIQGFYRTALLSAPLPYSATFLRCEPLVEDLIARCFSARNADEIRQHVNAAKEALRVMESL